MAIEIFAEKFRGFERINFELKQCNFVTGDNSSGKSSILLLLDYVIKTELNGDPELNKDLVTDRYDFFSPYFNFGDVTVGFIGREKKATGKVVTIRKRADGLPPQVVKLTWADENARITIKKSNQKASYKVTDGVGDLNADTLIDLHRETSGFKMLNLDDDEIHLEANSPQIIFSAIRSYGGREKIGRSIFAGTRVGHLPNVRHSGPLRGRAEQFYQLDRNIKPSGTHFAAMWHDMSGALSAKWVDEVKRFGTESTLFDEIHVEKISNKIVNSPMLVKVKKNGKHFLLGQVGVGVSQVIPIIVESLFESETPDKGFLLLQQPELHLHPVAQAALGQFIYAMASAGVYYVIETHSDFLIDRFRAMIRTGEASPTAQIIFCENKADGNSATIISIADNGEIEGAPENYKEFFVNELLRTMF